MVEAVNALDLLKEEMDTEEIHLKVNAIHRLKTVIMSIQTPENIEKLLVYLGKQIETQDDEVLYAIAEEMGQCWNLPPLARDKTLCLHLLERLATSDETVVREQATQSLQNICVDLSEEEMQNVFCPLVIRLSTSDWFTGRVSACSLFYYAYPKANNYKDKLRKKFMELCQEDTPMIRRVCAAKLGNFATQLEKQHVIQELIPIFRQLSQDDQDSCRVLCIESLIPMATYLSKEENRMHTLGSLLNAGEDKSWKVRLCFARNFAKFAEAFGSDITNNNLVQTFNLLLNDNEPEVKNAAINSLSKSFVSLSEEKICNILLPTLQATYADAQVAFKAGVGLALCEMAPIIGKSYCMNTTLPILCELLRDDNSEVRLNVASNLHKLSAVVGKELLNPSLLNQLSSLTKDGQWRVRMAIFDFIGIVGGDVGRETFNTNLEAIFFQYLDNNAASVRCMGVKKVGDLANDKAFGREWVKTRLIPKAVESYNVDQQSYNYRMCALESLSAIMPVLHEEEVTELVVPTIIKACNDRIPNVQFCVARIIKLRKSSFDASVFQS